jgi:hypothetical protein
MLMPRSNQIRDADRANPVGGDAGAVPDPRIIGWSDQARAVEWGPDIPADQGPDRTMTTKAAFTDEEWTTVLEGPTAAGMLVVMASRGGTFRETFAMSKAYVEAREQHGQSELLDEIASTRPKANHPKGHDQDELRAQSLALISTAVGIVAAKASPQELEDYRNFIVTLSNKVAAAHREDGQDVSPPEADAITAITGALQST